MEVFCDVTQVALSGCESRSEGLAGALALLNQQARRRQVEAVGFRLQVGEGLVLRGEVLDRGARISVQIKGRLRGYQLSEDGLQRAFGDLIREEHGSAPRMLDVYEKLLHSG